jgi:hypothetical protein
VRLTINVVDCTFDETEPTPAYHGLFICQDFKSASAAEAQANNRFAPEKVKINLIRTSVDGRLLTSDITPASVCASGDANQLIYIFNDRENLVAYNEARYPQLNIS